MKTKQKGFTLIEIIMVIAIIGLLSATVIPIYTDYLQRAKVSEALLLSNLKSPVLEFAYLGTDDGRWPATPTSVGVATSGSYATNVTIAKPKVWAQVNSLMSEGSIILEYNTTTGVWTCTHSASFSVRYLPRSCK